MSAFLFVRSAVACVCLASAASAYAQTATTPPPEAKGQPAPQGFSVVLALGDSQSTTVAENVPAAARKALADMKDFLPYRGYRLLDAQWILGSQRSTSRLRGPDDQEYQLTLKTTQVAGGRVSVVFQLQESSALTMIGMRDAADEAAARKAAEQELQARLPSEGPPRIAFGGRSVIDTTFSMDIGETVVVGTSRMRGGDKALIALLTAVPRGAATTKRE
jgi:hypothetical protein